MAAVMVELTARPVESDEVQLIADLDELSESNRCACSAGDDNPY